MNRSTNLSSVRRKRISVGSEEEMDINGRPLQPLMPTGGSTGNQNCLKVKLKKLNNSTKKPCVKCSLVVTSMLMMSKSYAVSYFLQRQDINSCQTVVNLMDGWRFLFTENEFGNYANELLGFNVQSGIQAALQDKGPGLIRFFRTIQSFQFNQ
jgi:hypothetical protein